MLKRSTMNSLLNYLNNFKPAAVKAAVGFILKRLGLAATGGWSWIITLVIEYVWKKAYKGMQYLIAKAKRDKKIDESTRRMNEATTEAERDDAFDTLS